MTQKSSEVILSSDEKKRSRAWCFTCNNYGDEDVTVAEKLGESAEYFVMGYEGADKTPHLQGYFYFKSQRTFQSMKKKLTQKYHLEIARGDAKQNRDYCVKEGNFIESGTVPSQGKRNDIIDFKQDVLDGHSKKELLNEHPEIMCKYPKFYNTCREISLDGQGMWPKEIIIISGSSGSGKSRYVYEHEEDHSKIWKTAVGCDGKWYDGYDGHEVAWFEEFKGQIELRDILQLTDRYPTKVPVKGGYVQWCPKRIYFTSTVHYKEWWIDERMEFERRVKEFGIEIHLRKGEIVIKTA